MSVTTQEVGMSMEGPLNEFSRALEATGQLVARIRSDQWSSPTPCPDWDVRTLLNHLVFGNQMFAGILGGESLPDRETLARQRAMDHLGDDPIAAYRESGDALLQAFSQPGALDRVYQVPAGSGPGIMLLHLRTTELLVHGWDLARATGQPARLPEDLAEQELAFARGSSAPDVPRTGQPFGPVQPATDDAPAIDRLAAYLGRSPQWGPDSPGV